MEVEAAAAVAGVSAAAAAAEQALQCRRRVWLVSERASSEGFQVIPDDESPCALLRAAAVALSALRELLALNKTDTCPTKSKKVI